MATFRLPLRARPWTLVPKLRLGMPPVSLRLCLVGGTTFRRNNEPSKLQTGGGDRVSGTGDAPKQSLGTRAKAWRGPERSLEAPQLPTTLPPLPALKLCPLAREF